MQKYMPMQAAPRANSAGFRSSAAHCAAFLSLCQLDFSAIKQLIAGVCKQRPQKKMEQPKRSLEVWKEVILAEMWL